MSDGPVHARVGLALVVRFLLELAAIVAIGWWGWAAGRTTAERIVLVVAAPLMAAWVWGAFIAPKAKWPASPPLRLFLQLVIFGGAAVGLAASGHRTLAVVFASLVLINGAMLPRPERGEGPAR